MYLGFTAINKHNQAGPKITSTPRHSIYLYETTSPIFSAKIGTKDSTTPYIIFNNKDQSSVSFSLNNSNSKSVQNNANQITFKEAQPNTDVIYSTTPNGIKEEIIIQKATSSAEYTFNLTTSGAHPRKIGTEIYSPFFFDDKNNYQFHFEKPFAIDAKGNRTDDVSMNLRQSKENKNTYQVQLIVPKKWLNDKSRKFPVTVDPTVVHDTTSEFATGILNRVKDTGSGSVPSLETYYQPLSSDIDTVAIWHLDEASGNALDSSGLSNTGTPTGTTVVTGLFGNARSFNGTSDTITITAGASSPLDLDSAPITTEAWIKATNNFSATSQVFFSRGTTGVSGYGMNITTTGLANCGAHGGSNFSGSTLITTGVWHHIACVTNGADSRLYVDGKLDGNGTVTIVANDINAHIGSAWNGAAASNFFGGQIDEVRVSNVARTSEEIRMNAQRRPYSIYTSDVIDFGTKVAVWNNFLWNEVGVTTEDGETLKSNTSLVAQWNFNETSGTTADNAEGTAARDGTLTGFASTGSQDAAAMSGWTSTNKRWGVGALMFDGTNDYVDAGSNASLQTTGDFTIESWFKSSDSAASLPIASYGTTSDWLYYYGISSGALTCKIYQANSGNGYIQATGPTTVNTADGQWHYGVCTVSGTTATLYLDGKVASVSGTPAGSRDVSSAGALTIGKFTNTVSLYFLGIIDSTRIYSRVLSQVEIANNYNAANIEFQTRVGATTTPDDGTWEAWKPITNETQITSFDSSDSSLVSYWSMAEDSGTNIADRQGTNTGTSTNATVIQGVYGRARSFAGTGYINVSDHASLDLTVNFTLMGWINRTGGGAGYIVSKFGPTGGGGYALLYGNSGEVYCRTDNGVTFADSYTATNHVISTSGWVHVAAVRTGSSCRVFINGVDQTVTTATHTTMTANAQPLKIGARPDDNSSPVTGYIDEVRVFSSALSQAQILSYMGSSTHENLLRISRDTNIKMEGAESQTITSGRQQLDGYTIGLWHLDETSGTSAYIKDSTTNVLHGTPTGTNVVNGISLKGRVFNGTSDFIDMGDTSLVDFGAGNFTIEAWVKRSSLTTEDMIVAKDNNPAGTRQFVFKIGATDDVRIGYYVATDTIVYLASTTTITNTNWHHVVGLRSGNSFSIYVDGVLSNSGTTAGSHGTMQSTTAKLQIGRREYASSEEYFDGSIDEVKISNVARTAYEISESYRLGRDHYINRYITSTDLSGKTTLPFYIAADRPGTYLSLTAGESLFANWQADADTVGLWHLDDPSGSGGGIDSSGALNNGTLSGTSFTKGLIGNARYFNASITDYVAIADSSTTQLATPMTVEAWFKTGAVPAANSSIVRKDTKTGTRYLYGLLYLTTGYINAQYYNGVNFLVPSLHTVFDNQWHYAVSVISGTTLSLYLDGVFQGSTTITGTQGVPTGEMDIGCNPDFNGGTGRANSYVGFVDEVRLSRIARTATEIRQAYEVGLRTHPITIDFASAISHTGPLSGSSDLSFTLMATPSGTTNAGDNIYKGDKIIVRENVNGTEYIAQGTVDSVNISTGATTVSSWDAASTFPTGGFTPNATTFKWQREYWTVDGGVLDTSLDAVTKLTFRLTNGFEGRSVWVDDLRSNSANLTTPGDIGNTSYPTQVSSASDTTTTSATDVQMDSMAIVPGAGDYKVYFSSSIKKTIGNSSQYISLYVGGVQVAHTERLVESDSSYDAGDISSHPITIQAYVAGVGASDVVEIKWRTDTSTATAHERTLIVQPVTASDLSQATATATTTTTSATDVQISGMTLTPGAGDYLVDFSSSMKDSSAGDVYFSIYVNGVQVAHSERYYYVEASFTASSLPVATHAYVSGVGAGQVIEVKWRRSAGTVSALQRTLTVQKVTAANITQATATATTTTTSATDTQINSMTLTPGAGNYLILFGTSIQNTDVNGSTQNASIYVNGVQLAHSERQIYTESSFDTGSIISLPVMAHAYVLGVGTSDVIEVKWRTSGGTETAYARTLTLIKTSSASSNISSSTGYRYFQYRSVLNSIDTAVTATLSAVKVDYTLNVVPEIPALDSPANAFVGSPISAVLKTTSTDTNTDYLRYKIELCTNAGMTVGCQTFDQTSSQTGWSGQNTQTSTAYTPGTQATYTLQSPLSTSTTYYWRSYAIDPNGANSWSATQASPYSFTTNSTPATPTLDLPANSATNVTTTTVFKTTATDADSDYLRYKIKVCTNNAMTIACQTFDQTSSQTGWSGQNTQTSTAYTSGTQATYTVQTPLSVNTTYYWQSYAIDPAGLNTFTTAQAVPNSFTTFLSPPQPSACTVTKNTANTQIIINWTDNATSEIGYQVWKVTDGAAPVQLGSNLAADTVTLTDTAVSNGHSYGYLIRNYQLDGAITYYSNYCVTAATNLNTGFMRFEGIQFN